MNFSVKGRFFKEEDKWTVQFPIIDNVVSCSRPLQCLQEFEKVIQRELNDESVKCFFKISDSGVIYLVTAHTPEFIKFLAEKITDISAVKLEPGLSEFED